MAPIEIGDSLVEVDVLMDGAELTVYLSVHRDGEFIEEHELTYSLIKRWEHDKSDVHRPDR